MPNRDSRCLIPNWDSKPRAPYRPNANELCNQVLVPYVSGNWAWSSSYMQMSQDLAVISRLSKHSKVRQVFLSYQWLRYLKMASNDLLLPWDSIKNDLWNLMKSNSSSRVRLSYHSLQQKQTGSRFKKQDGHLWLNPHEYKTNHRNLMNKKLLCTKICPLYAILHLCSLSIYRYKELIIAHKHFVHFLRRLCIEYKLHITSHTIYLFPQCLFSRNPRKHQNT